MLSIELDPTQLDLKEEAHKNIAEILDDIKRRASEAGVEATLTESPDGKIKYEVILPDRKITLIQETTAEGVTTQMKVELVAEPLLEVWDEGASVNMDKKGRFFIQHIPTFILRLKTMHLCFWPPALKFIKTSSIICANVKNNRIFFFY